MKTPEEIASSIDLDPDDDESAAVLAEDIRNYGIRCAMREHERCVFLARRHLHPSHPLVAQIESGWVPTELSYAE